ncbi:putative phage protein (TIGR02218 family) [Stutzerimonas stutzeri]|nr:putative phage protein (TIGR02218 family) [Stutzerimonas stutzeri]
MTTTTVARAWSVRRTDGLTLGFTDHDQRLVFGGVTFRPDRGLTARALVQGTGLSVDNSEAVGALNDDAITERDLMAGRWDQAELRMWEVDWSDVTSRKLVFRGSLGEVSRANGAFRAELRGLSEALNAPQGRVYHPRCSARLGDGACRVDLSAESLSVLRQVQGMDEGRVFTFIAFPAFDAAWFDHGRLEVLSGAAQGLHGAVKNDTARPGGQRIIELWSSLGILPATGDQIRLTAGCDKAADTCRLKFRNQLNFRGFPHLPSEDWLMAPQAGRRNG